jgi:cytokinin riboside 5'-monophosphate phosphoribohydrolase
VFCSSSNNLDREYFMEAETLADLICSNNHNLVYGGTTVGLMGVVAAKVKASNRKVTGVIPQLIYEKGIGNRDADELIITKNMRERKAAMHTYSDAFVALPGGFGTLEEVMEVITLKQLQYHNKPVVLVNTRGYFNSLNNFFEHMYRERFASEKFRSLYRFVEHAGEAIDYLNNYTPVVLRDKWE